MALDTTSLAALLEALRSWLLQNPDGDIQDFADEHGVEVADLADGWNANFTQGDFSRNYNLGTETNQTGGAQSAVQAAPVYTPSEPPPYGSSPDVYHEYLTQEVHNYQDFTTTNNITNNIEDNSFNQQIVDSEVQQEIDIDNSDVTQGDDSVNIDDSDLDNTDVNTGDVDDGGVLQQGDGNGPVNTGDLDDGSVLQQGDGDVANTGDVSATDGSSASVFGDATTVGSGNDNFGDGQNVTTTTVGDGNETAVVTQDNDTDIDQDVSSGDSGDATGGDGGEGGDGSGGSADGGDGGDGGPDFYYDGGDGGDGGSGGFGGDGGGDAGGGDATSGDTGSVDAHNDVDNDVHIDFH